MVVGNAFREVVAATTYPYERVRLTAGKRRIATDRLPVSEAFTADGVIVFGILIRRKYDEEDARRQRLPGCGGRVRCGGAGGARPHASPTRPHRATWPMKLGRDGGTVVIGHRLAAGERQSGG